MLRPLSIGARLVLLYSAVMLATVSLPIAYVHSRVQRMIAQEARSIVSDYAAEVEAELAEDPAQPQRAVDEVQALAARLQPDLAPGLAVFDEAGRARAASGALRGVASPLPVGGPSPPNGAARRLRLADRQPYLAYARATPAGLVQAAISTRRFDGSLRRLRNSTALSMLGAVLLTAASGLWLARRSLRPIDTITRTAREIGADRLDRRIPVRGSGDELDRLAETLNEMIDRVEEGVGRLRQLSIDVAHQLKSPLGALRNRLEVTLETEPLPPRARELLARTAEDLGDVAQGVSAVLELARSSAGLPPEQVREVELGELLEAIAALFEPSAALRGIRIERAPAPPCRVRGHPAWLRELFAALVENAIRYSPAGGTVRIGVEARAGEAVAWVADQGPGVPADELPHLFERFRRGRSAEGTAGLGLGLALAREFARAHGGEVEVESRPGAGSRFRVRLPQAP